MLKPLNEMLLPNGLNLLLMKNKVDFVCRKVLNGIQLDMSDQEVITLDSDDELEPASNAELGSSSNLGGADLIVGPTGTAVPVSQAAKHGLPRLPLPPGSDFLCFIINHFEILLKSICKSWIL